MQAARAAGTRVVLDIDYRPVLWGLTSPGLGEQRYVRSDRVSEHLQTVLPLCDLIVGTEEEVHIAGGSPESLAALRRIRELSTALIVMKRGPMGCVAFPAAIPERVDDGAAGPGFPVEVFNVLGAGDAFMAGLLRGWVRDEPLANALRYANACGALVVSRHGCAPAMPSWIELSHFLAHGSPTTRLREDVQLEHIHRATTRTRRWPSLAVLAFDHRSQFDELARSHGANGERIAAFKQLVADAAQRGYADAQRDIGGTAALPSRGVIVDGRFGGALLPRLTGHGGWVARPVEVPGSRPLAFEAADGLWAELRSWPAEQVVKCLLSHDPDDDAALAARQLATLCHARARVPRHRPRVAGRGDPTDRSAQRCPHAGPRIGAGLRGRRVPRLVEAAAARWRCGVARDRRGDRRSRSALPRRAAARAGRHRGRAVPRAFASPPRSRSARASRSAARSSPTRRPAGSPARSTTPAWSSRWPRATSG